MSEDQLDALLEAGDDDYDGGSDDSTEYESYASAKSKPTVGLAGEVVDVFWTGSLMDDDGNLEQQDELWYNDVGVTLRNPTVIGGTIWRNGVKDDVESGLVADVEPDDRTYRNDYRIEPANDNDLTDDGQFAGRNGLAEGEIVESFDEDEVTFFFTSGAKYNLARQLDVSGGNAYIDEDGEPVLGLIEVHHDGGERRFARYPELRPDLEGEEIIIRHALAKDVIDDFGGNARAHNITVFRNDFEGDNMSEATQVELSRKEPEGADDVVLRWEDREVDDEDVTPDVNVGMGGDDIDLGEFEEFIDGFVASLRDNGLSPDEDGFDFENSVENQLENNGFDVSEDDVDAVAGEIVDRY